jgi:hypothetical protein
MKKVLIIVTILVAPFLTVAQSENTSTVNEEIVIVATPITTETTTNQTASSKINAQAVEMTYKKSNDIISIKAFRKSLQIKVKDVKLC